LNKEIARKQIYSLHSSSKYVRKLSFILFKIFLLKNYLGKNISNSIRKCLSTKTAY
jgi:hypothetical protein